jgi:hypothetical protein
MLMAYAVALLIGGLVKVTEYDNLKYLAIGYFILALIVSLIFNNGAGFGLILAVLTIKSLLVYGWIILLYKYEDTVFTYLFLLIIGTFLLGRF